LTLNAATDPSLPSLADRDAVDDERLSTVALLRDVVNDSRFASRKHELRVLASAVRHGGSREAVWRGVNLQQVFTPESTISLPPRWRRRLARVVGVLAAIFTVLTVGWTWWSFGQAAEVYQRAPGLGILEVVRGSGMLIIWSVLLIVGGRLLSRSADSADDADLQQGAAQLAQALNCASITINNSRTVQEPIRGLDVFTEATQELLRTHQATRQTVQLLHGAAQRLEDSAVGIVTSTGAVASSASAVGKSLGQHTAALQHQISELTQIRASLERLSGLQSVDGAGAWD
jgi:hypothetical protein